MQIIFMDGHDHSAEEEAAYRAHAMSRYPQAIAVLVDFDGEDALLDYEMPRVPFERIRRITGYLVGTTDRWNNAKQAEEHDRVKHGLGYIPANVCVSCGAEMAEGDHVCTLCRDMTRGRVDRAPGFDSRRDG